MSKLKEVTDKAAVKFVSFMDNLKLEVDYTRTALVSQDPYTLHVFVGDVLAAVVTMSLSPDLEVTWHVEYK